MLLICWLFTSASLPDLQLTWSWPNPDLAGVVLSPSMKTTACQLLLSCNFQSLKSVDVVTLIYKLCADWMSKFPVRLTVDLGTVGTLLIPQLLSWSNAESFVCLASGLTQEWERWRDPPTLFSGSCTHQNRLISGCYRSGGGFQHVS